MMIEDLVLRWESIELQSGDIHQEYSATHPLRLFFGKDIIGNYEFIIKLNSELSKIPNSNQSIQVQLLSEMDGQFLLVFKLLKSNEKSVFIHLFWDLAEVSYESLSNSEGIEKILERFKKWQLLMDRGQNGLLSVPEIKGLLGEILFLESMFEVHTFYSAVEGWMGPTGADQDFSYRDLWYEIKSLDPSAITVGISSIEQLDRDSIGQLTILFLEAASPQSKEATTLYAEIQKVRKAIARDYGASLLFEEKLILAGYIDRNEYDSFYFYNRGKRAFQVNANFPSLKRSQLDICIVKAEYQLAISGLSRWELKKETFENGYQGI